MSEPTRDVTPLPENLSASAAPGIYPTGQASQLGFWDGRAWDPRPVAPMWTRVWCNVIDVAVAGVIWLVLALLVVVPVALMTPEPVPGSGTDPSARLISFTTLAVAFLGYFTVSYRLWGRTPGMMLGKLHVVRIPTGGAPMSWSDSFLRALVLCLGYSCGILALVWLAITAGSKRKQGPHDSAAYTVVLAGDKPRPMPPPPASAPPAQAAPDQPPAMPPSGAALAAQPPLAHVPVVQPLDASTRSRGPMIAGIVAGCVVMMTVMIGVGVFVDSRIRVNEMNQLLAATQASEQVLRDYLEDPEWVVIGSQLEILGSLGTLSPQDRANALDRISADAADVAERHVGPTQGAVLDVEEVSVLPWHGDIAAARDAYADHADAWLQVISAMSFGFPDDALTAEMKAERMSTWATAERRFDSVRILWMPADIPKRIRELFADQ